METTLSIGGRPIGPDHPPFVIAEMSGNHNASLDRALAIVDAAAEAGADALKLQTYTADTMTLSVTAPGFRIDDRDSLWHGEHLYDLYQKAHTPWEWHLPIMERARARGLLCFSSPFDMTAVDFLQTLDVPCYKVASFECVDLPLIRRIATTGKPVIISTGMATLAEIEDAVGAARGAGCRDLVLLKCTSTYPASADSTNLRTIPHLRETFSCEVGLSDHTMGLGVPVAAVAFGASVIEKHFTLSRADGGVDSAFSVEPAELRSLVIEIRRAYEALGHVSYGAAGGEQKSLVHRRSLYVVQDMHAGEPFTAANVRAIRPGLGLAPKYYDAVLGRISRRELVRGTPLSWDLVD